MFGSIGVLGWVPFDPEALQIVRDQGTEADYAHTLNGWRPRFGAEVDELIARVDGWQDPAARMYALGRIKNAVHHVHRCSGLAQGCDQVREWTRTGDL